MEYVRTAGDTTIPLRRKAGFIVIRRRRQNKSSLHLFCEEYPSRENLNARAFHRHSGSGRAGMHPHSLTKAELLCQRCRLLPQEEKRMHHRFQNSDCKQETRQPALQARLGRHLLHRQMVECFYWGINDSFPFVIEDTAAPKSKNFACGQVDN